MRVSELFSSRPALSFEFFPPKNPEQESNLYKVLGELIAFTPDFASVTYGAMGTNREKTFFWVKEIKEKFAIEPVAHLTCVAATREDIAGQLNRLGRIGVENILAIRGDPPADQPGFIPPADGFRLAHELIAFIKAKKPAICVGAAGFPEGHPLTPSPEKDIEYLKQKIDAGAEYVITQLFFDNRHFFNFLNRCRLADIYVPIVPGIMPITNFKQVKKMTEICGATIPVELLKKLEKHAEDKAAIEAIGVEHAIVQCKELLAADVPGLHFFVMNQADPISRILKELRK